MPDQPTVHGQPAAPRHVGHRWRRPMRARLSDEPHRASTPLELLFDLCFVVAIALTGARLHHALGAAEIGRGLLGYGMVFFAIWWAWMNFTWFASAYDSDDGPYRVATLIQIAGALVLAAGVPRAFDERDFAAMVVGYVLMRLAMVGQWLRAARADVPRRPACLRYAGGVAAVQIGWSCWLLLPPPWQLSGFVSLAVCELLVPIWAELAAPTSWHPGHITERYGLFTLIVLGESVQAATTALQSALDLGARLPMLVLLAGAGLVIVFALWWLYFAAPVVELLTTLRTAITWGYGHLLIFAAVAAVGTGLQLAVDATARQGVLSPRGTALALAVPVAAFLLMVWLLHVIPARSRVLSAAFPLAALAVLGVAAVPGEPPVPVLLIAAVLVALVVVKVVVLHRAAAP